MNIALRRSWTQEEFFAWAQKQEIRYEFDGFQPVAMTGGNNAHSCVARNVIFSLRLRLRNGPCQPIGPDAGVETVNRAVRYPEALVTCSPIPPAGLTVPDPVVIFEVLSPTSGRTDRIVKPREYAAVPSIRRYVILESASIGLTVFARETPSESWRATTLTGEDTLHMPEIGIEIPVAELYEGVPFPDEDQPETRG